MRTPTHIRSLVASALTGALLLSACGGDADSDDGSASEPGSSDTAFPATVEGIYGDVTIEERPERVVALNPHHAEMLDALGVQPVAVGADEQQIEATTPWLVDVFETVDGSLFENNETNLEQVASYDPDLIVGYGSYQLLEEIYGQAQDIATTFPGLAEGAPNPPWQETLRALAMLTGTDAEPVIDEVDAACEEAREAIPQWQGRTYQLVGTVAENIKWGNGTALECFGLVPAGNQNNDNDGSGISYENLDELDADVLVIWDAVDREEQITADPRYASLPSVANESVVWLPAASPIAYATNSVGGPRTFEFLIDELLPSLESTTPAS
ncbi:hypothetical protein BHE97_04670 [Aeromicrobium sp. PE09-221]|uniref:ABC transporter substrate-binding protein n=1 Tax=Aeromicrobium sp. PE09-221 TaxID=1898043 RepID=UPI000B699B71|nr:ABC transporter substrate-binding protein [Aeromicrobium sp. PE09-221]OUZ11151.1 hypothetical protein BHE97_04670 [Aeromicrobium sp. PE09-221]